MQPKPGLETKRHMLLRVPYSGLPAIWVGDTKNYMFICFKENLSLVWPTSGEPNSTIYVYILLNMYSPCIAE